MNDDPIQRAAEVLDDHQRFGGTSDTAYRFTCTCDRYGALYDHDTRVFAAHQAQTLADAGLLPTAPPVKPSRDDVAQAMYTHRMAVGDFPDGLTEWDELPESWREEYREAADAVLALLPGRTVAEVKAEALREAAEAIDWEWETFRASDGMPSIRMHGKTPGELLTARAEALSRRPILDALSREGRATSPNGDGFEETR